MDNIRPVVPGICPLIQVACPTPEVASVSALTMAQDMLEEAQREVRYTTDRIDAMCLIAKRDALGELIGRLKHGRRNSLWARVRPKLSIPMPLVWVLVSVL